MDVSRAFFSPALFEPERQPARATSLADLLLRVARRYPRAGLVLASAERDGKAVLVTYPALLEQSRRILSGLRAHGRAAGEKVALLLEKPGDFIPAFWACVLGGYVPCPLVAIRNDPERWARHLTYIDALLEGPLLVSTGDLKQELPSSVNAVELSALRANPVAEGAYEAKPEDPAVLVLTSGSTGNSKAVVLTHANLLASMVGKVERQELTDADVTLNWISFDHIAAISEAHLLPLHVGAMQLHVDPASVLANPLLFLQLIDRYRVSMTFTPNFLLGQINVALQAAASEGAQHPPPFDLSCLRHIICGGEAIVVETARRFLDLLAPCGLARSALWPAFGMTETCAGSVYSREFPDADGDREFACLGAPVTGLHMRIVDDLGAVLPDGQSGELQLRGPMVFSRYYNNDEATRAAFTADGWFRTGDLGRIDTGRLSLVGRSKDSIIVSGVNYFSHELETALQELQGIERAFVAAFPTRPKGADTEQLVVTFATSFALEDEAALHQLTVAVRNTTILLWGFRPASILPLPKQAFPKTSLGKIQRSMLRSRLEAGELAAYEAHIAEVTSRQLGGYTAPSSPLEYAMVRIYADLFGLDCASLSVTASFFDLGGTSLEILKLKQELARQLGLQDLQVATILQNPSVRELAACAAPERRRERRKYDPIVPLQLTGSKTPLFCVHPGIGEVLVFVNLAKYFVNDRPFYALRARGFNEDEQYFSSFDELVFTYAHAIRRRQPHGPYALAGYSYGAPVAFEIAKLLELKGERVAFVGSIDMPPSLNQPVDAVDCAVNLAFFLSLIDMQQAQELPDKLRRALPGQDPSAQLLRLATPERLATLDIDLAKFRAWSALAYALINVARPYVPSGTVESVSVFAAQPLRGTRHEWLNDQLRRWDDFSRAPVRYLDVPGKHHAIMGPKYVSSFQSLLRTEIDRAMGGR